MNDNENMYNLKYDKKGKPKKQKVIVKNKKKESKSNIVEWKIFKS